MRSPRYKKQPETVGGLRIQKRDYEIIKLAYEYRFLNSKQIQALVKGSDQVTLRRLQKLFHHGYLDRPVSQIIFSNPLLGHQSMVYGLGDKGADLLAEQLGVDRGSILWREKNKEVREQYIQHTLMISNFRACLTLALKTNSKAKLIFWIRENSEDLKEKEYVYIKEGEKQKRLPIVPDGLFCIEESGDKMYFFLEADRSTMTNTRFLNKMKAYWHWWKQAGQKKKFGIKNFRVLTLTRTRQRMDNLIRVTQKVDEKQEGSYMFWFVSEKSYQLGNTASILGEIWQTPRDNKWHHLLE